MTQITMTREQYTRQMAWTRASARHKMLNKLQTFIDNERKKLSKWDLNKLNSNKGE